MQYMGGNMVIGVTEMAFMTPNMFLTILTIS